MFFTDVRSISSAENICLSAVDECNYNRLLDESRHENRGAQSFLIDSYSCEIIESNALFEITDFLVIESKRMDRYKSTGEMVSQEKVDQLLQLLVNVSIAVLMFLPQFAHAQSVGGPFGGIKDFLKSITQLVIYEWGYYIGIITLAIQGYRWKTGRIDLMQLGGWGMGIALVFFAPNIVSDLRARSAGSIQ